MEDRKRHPAFASFLFLLAMARALMYAVEAARVADKHWTRGHCPD